VSQGRLDVTLEVPGEAFVVFEAKIKASLGDNQVKNYLEHLGEAESPWV
jgi:hypothetical protein